MTKKHKNKMAKCICKDCGRSFERLINLVRKNNYCSEICYRDRKRINYKKRNAEKIQQELTYNKQDLLNVLNKYSKIGITSVARKQSCCYSSTAVKKLLSFIIENNSAYDDNDVFINSLEYLESIGGCLIGRSRLVLVATAIYTSNKERFLQMNVAAVLFVSEVAIKQTRNHIEKMHY